MNVRKTNIQLPRTYLCTSKTLPLRVCLDDDSSFKEKNKIYYIYLCNFPTVEYCSLACRVVMTFVVLFH